MYEGFSDTTLPLQNKYHPHYCPFGRRAWSHLPPCRTSHNQWWSSHMQVTLFTLCTPTQCSCSGAGVAPCLYTPSILTHAHVQLGKTPQYGSCICQQSLFVTIVGRDSSPAKRHRLGAYMRYGPQRSGIIVRIYALWAPKS